MKSILRTSLLALLIFMMLFGLLGGCASPHLGQGDILFSNNSALAEHAQNTYWISQPQYASSEHFIVCCFTTDRCVKIDLSRNSGESLTDMFQKMLQKIQLSGHSLDYKDVYEFLSSRPSADGLVYTVEEITYNWEENSAFSASGSSVWRFYTDNTMKHHGDSYSRSEYLVTLERAFDEACKKIQDSARDAFFRKYPNIPSYKDVKYDPYSYLRKNFIITGSAELDDYYNYEYYDLEQTYFCIAIEPVNGSYSDRWYIYAKRKDFPELFQALKNGKGASITLICQGQFTDATKNSLATLIDYFIS